MTQDTARLLINYPGSQLRKWRQERGYKLRDVAKLSGLSVSYLSDIERGRTLPSLKALRTILKLMDGFSYPMESEA